MSTVKIGIPRGLIYYNYHPLWRAFFQALGAEVVVSPPTNRDILNRGVEKAESEFCLPVKLYYGHALFLKDLVDVLFIPRVISVEEKAYTCPKLLGLPDMIGAVDKALPPIWAPEIDLTKGRRHFYSSIFNLGKALSRSSLQIFIAYIGAVKEYWRFQYRLKHGVPRVNALEDAAYSSEKGNGSKPVTIGIVGHEYNIFDSYITMNLMNRLEKLGAKVVTSDSIPHKTILREASTLPKHLFWTYEKDIIGAAFHWLKEEQVDGIVYVLAFACGPDSLIQSLLEYESKRIGKIPLMSLVIDEHSGEAGMITRLEAFVDMLMRAKGRCNED